MSPRVLTETMEGVVAYRLWGGEEDDDFCHIVYDDGTRYCDGRGDREPYCRDFTGESICPDCGQPMCPACVTLVSVEAQFE